MRTRYSTSSRKYYSCALLGAILAIVAGGLFTACAAPGVTNMQMGQAHPQIIIRFNDAVTPNQKFDQQLADQAQVTLRRLGPLGDAYLYEILSINPNPPVSDILEKLNENEKILYAEPNRRVQRLQ